MAMLAHLLCPFTEILQQKCPATVIYYFPLQESAVQPIKNVLPCIPQGLAKFSLSLPNITQEILYKRSNPFIQHLGNCSAYEECIQN
jgi:hypothetical protein